MTRERSHKGSGHPRKNQPTREGRNDARQAVGTNQQQLAEEEEREGEAFGGAKPEQQGERALHPSEDEGERASGAR